MIIPPLRERRSRVGRASPCREAYSGRRPPLIRIATRLSGLRSYLPMPVALSQARRHDVDMRLHSMCEAVALNKAAAAPTNNSRDTHRGRVSRLRETVAAIGSNRTEGSRAMISDVQNVPPPRRCRAACGTRSRRCAASRARDWNLSGTGRRSPASAAGHCSASSRAFSARRRAPRCATSGSTPRAANCCRDRPAPR